MANKIQELLKQEAFIAQYYKNLANLEIAGLNTSLEYEYYFQQLSRELKTESLYFQKIIDENQAELQEEIDKDSEVLQYPYIPAKKTFSLGLRLKNTFDGILGDEVLEYAGVLQTDIYQIVLQIIESLLQYPKYQAIQEGLIWYKFKIIHSNYNIENDFISKGFQSTVLMANQFRTNSFPGTFFLDKALLVYDIEKDLSFLYEISGDSIDDTNQFLLVVIHLLNIFARFMLIDEKLIKDVYYQLQAILESDVIPQNLKEIMYDMLDILDRIKNKISWSK